MGHTGAVGDQFRRSFRLSEPTGLSAIGQLHRALVDGRTQFPFQLGYATLVFGILAFWYWRIDATRWQGSDLSRLLAFGFTGVLLLIVLVLPVSTPIWMMSRADRLLTYPWQLLLLAGPLMAAIAGSLPALNESLKTHGTVVDPPHLGYSGQLSLSDHRVHPNRPADNAGCRSR